MSMAGSPNFGKALFTLTLDNILNKTNVENFDMVRGPVFRSFYFFCFLEAKLPKRLVMAICQ